MKHTITIILLFILLSCASHNQVQPTSVLNFNEKKTIQVSEKIIVGDGEVFDGKGNLYVWVGEGDCSQTEGMPPMFVLLSNATLKNISIKNAPDGVHIKGSNVTIDNMVNVDVCEDAISISKSKHFPTGNNIKIVNSKFYHCEDKAIQLTRGDGVLIKNNEFYSCAKAVRIKEQAKRIYFEDNKVFDSKHAVKVTGGQGVIKNNVFNGSKTGLWVEKEGTLIDGGGNTFINVIEKYRETEKGKILDHLQ